ncbi:hypothetical protein [Aquimarina aquimarini]|uniref:hypothetical protein n=1 Tax=Aquimarina aquimarini TaxID=1191734 RepID=UPI000D55BDA9|nr:hypothetical protein [Aquimarina aquimarini]
MNTQQKIIVSWILITLGVVTHNTLEVGESIFFKSLPEKPFNDGVPIAVHIIHILAMILPMVIAFITLFYANNTFKIFSLVYAIVLVLLNTAHLAETLGAGFSNYSQIILLLFIVIVNAIIIPLIIRWKKENLM